MASGTSSSSVAPGTGESQAASGSGAHLVLVHGAWQGSWVWHKLIPLLEKANHKVTAVSLAAHGTDMTPAADLTTLTDITAPVRKVVEDSEKPVILVGHSLGGMVISVVAEAVPDKVAKLVYLAAMLVPDGKCVFDLYNLPEYPVKLKEYFSAVKADTQDESSPPVFAGLKEGAVEDCIFPRCPREEQVLANLLFRLEPMLSFTLPITVTAPRWGSIPRYYIYPETDEVVSLELQKHMVETVGVEKTWSVADTDHQPHVSNPAGLSLVFEEIANI